MRSPGIWISSLTVPISFKEALYLVRLCEKGSYSEFLYEKLWGGSFTIYSVETSLWLEFWSALADVMRLRTKEAEALLSEYRYMTWWRPNLIADTFLPAIALFSQHLANRTHVVWTCVECEPGSKIQFDDYFDYIEYSLDIDLSNLLSQQLSRSDFPMNYEDFFHLIDKFTTSKNEPRI